MQGEKKNLSKWGLCVQFGSPGHENVWEPPSLHMCGYLFETFPPVLASCSTFYLLVCSRVSYRRRGSEVLSHAVQLKSTFFFFSFFFDTWQIINGGLAALRRSSVWTHQMRCLTAQVHTDKNLLMSVFMRLVHHSSWLWFMLWAESFCSYIPRLHLSSKIKKELSPKLSFNMSPILFIIAKITFHRTYK